MQHNFRWQMGDLPHVNSVSVSRATAPSSDTDVLIQALPIVLDGALADWYEGARVRSRGCRLIRARCSIRLWQSPDARPRAMSIGDLWTTIEPFHRCGIGLALISRHS